MMGRKATAGILTGAMLLGSFLCLGMGMDMGTAWAPQQSHDCCPGGAPAQSPDTNCCLLLPGAVSAPMTVPPPVLVAVLIRSVSVLPLVGPVAAPHSSESPPGLPDHASPAAPRAPPVA